MAMAPQKLESDPSVGEEQDFRKDGNIAIPEEQEFGDISHEKEQVNYYPGELVDHWPSFANKGLYHCYSLGLKRNFDYDVAFSDIALIVKCDLGGDFMNTCFSLGGNVSVNMEYSGVIRLDIDQVNVARRFQIMVLRILIDHNMRKLKDALDGLQQEETIPKTSYLLLPTIGHDKNLPIIDWDCVRSCLFSSGVVCSSGMVMGNGVQHCCSSEDVHLVQTKNGSVCHCMLTNSLVFTPHNGMVYCTTCILEDLDGNSLIKIRRGKARTYKEHYQDRYGITLRYERESLLGGKNIFTVKNWLHRRQSSQKKESNNFVELPPELCVVLLNIKISTLYSFSFVPSIMHRIESLLLAARLKIIQMVHYTQNVFVPALKVLEAITTNKCQEEFSLESLETLGDSFLKYAASQQLFRSNMYHREGLLTDERVKMICNATLCKLGCKQKLQGFIQNESFDPKRWIIPGDRTVCVLEDDVGFSTSKVIYSRGTKLIKGEVVADVVEALIGAYLSTDGELTALFLMEWLGMKIDFVNKVPNDKPFLEKPDKYVNVHHLESLLNYQFHDPSLLLEALTHGSDQLPHIPRCYERLEFLGDAVLDYLITRHVYKKYPGLSPGLLTDLRSASVNNDCFGRAAARAGLNEHIRASPELEKQITSFVEKFQSFSEPIFGWDEETHVPKVLADVIESIAGAILVDSGFDKDAVWESIRPLLEPLVTPDTIKYHPKRELEEICKKKYSDPQYIVKYHDGVVSITIEVQVDRIRYSETRTGSNKDDAEKFAAKAVLNKLKASVPGTV